MHPEVAKLLPVLYPGVFPNLAAYTKPRADLVAILGTGIPAGVVPGFQNYTGKTVADMLRLNMAIPATPADKVSPAGLAGGDAAGFPNGRRLTDDVVTIELRAIAGLLIPLVDKSFTPDAATSKVTDGSPATPTQLIFPYLNSAARRIQRRRSMTARADSNAPPGARRHARPRARAWSPP